MRRALVLFTLALCIHGCDTARRRPGGVPGSGQTQPPSADATTGQDALDPSADAQPGFQDAMAFDFGFIDTGVPPEPDAGFVIDVGFPGRDALPIDMGVPPPFDSGVRIDTGVVFPDATLPPIPDAGVRPDSGVVNGITASIVGTSSLIVNTMAGPGVDPISYTVSLQFNSTNASPVQVNVDASFNLIIAPITLPMTPPTHLALPGTSNGTFSSMTGGVAGTEMIVALLCILPLPFTVDVLLSNGQILNDSVAVTCQ